MQRPLEGVRILECGLYHAGPGGSAILGDLGAEVIKIEQPKIGDPIRVQKQIGNMSFAIKGDRSIFCEGSNRNKKSVTIDLKSEKGIKIVYDLAKKSDVFLTNMRPKALESLKLTYSILREINPKMIYASVSAFGNKGPDCNKGGFDYQGQARSSLMYCMGEEGMTPLVSQFGLIDQVTAIMTSHQILTALYMRERTGIAQEVHVSIMSSAMCLLYLNILIECMGGEVPRHTRSNEYPLRNYYKCSDERWIMMTLTPPDKMWSSLCKALGHPELEDDPRFNSMEKVHENAEKLITIFDEIFATRTLDEWLSIFAEYDLFCCAVNSLKDLAKDCQVIANDYLVDFNHPTLGTIKIPGYPVSFSESWAQTSSAAPDLGEHTNEVLMEITGHTAEEIKELKNEGVI
ncbi:MAG: CoA transferase [Spirochaetota bacterium]|nr:CoA transferase [Spirochaetota bacterium]